MNTTPIKALVREVLASLPQPYSEHIIDEVFAAIEGNPEWLREYKSLVASFTKTVANNWIGYWVANALGKVSNHVAPSKLSSLVGSYSVLGTDAKTMLQKPKEPEALQLMAAYYQAHKAELPVEVRKHRDQIVELIMEGHPASEAFQLALQAASDA